MGDNESATEYDEAGDVSGIAEHPPLLIQFLTRQHDRSAFDCGRSSLNSFLKYNARDDAARFAGGTFVGVLPSDPGVIAGFYTLVYSQIDVDGLPEGVAKRLPRYSKLPAILLGRLAIDKKFQGNGYGKFLMIDAMRASLDLARRGGGVVLLVDAIDENAAKFYESFDFKRFQDKPLNLHLPMRKIEAEFS
jgi:GNAT superfamily N-acetyltransferase